MRVNLDREKKFRFDSNFHPGLQFISTTVYARVGLIPTLVSIHVAINRQYFTGKLKFVWGGLNFTSGGKKRKLKLQAGEKFR